MVYSDFIEQEGGHREDPRQRVTMGCGQSDDEVLDGGAER
jgi:hypothetical protein